MSKGNNRTIVITAMTDLVGFALALMRDIGRPPLSFEFGYICFFDWAMIR
jgi:hypothetical protein